MSDPRHPLHPQVAALFEFLKAGRVERVLKPGPMREAAAGLGVLLSQTAPPVAAEDRLEIPGPAGVIPARVFYPGAPSDGPYPVIVYFHGGGYVLMSADTHERWTKQLCNATGSVIVSVDYRLAPEHPFPAPIDDCLAAYRWVRAHAERVAGDPARVAVSGDSAGGNASVAVALRLRAAGESLPAALLLYFPWVDMSLTSESFRRLAPDDLVIDEPAMRLFRDAYVGEAPIDDPLASPLRADLRGLPETLVVVGEIDPLCDEGIALARSLEGRGVKVELRSYPGMPHDFVLFPGIDATDRVLEETTAFVRRVI